MNETSLINKAYSKRLKKLNKNFFNNRRVGLSLFIEYLRYLRDVAILNNYDTPEKQLSVAALIAAIVEFEAFEINKNKTNKVFHWNNFIELVKHNMEDWLQIDDSV